MKMDFFDYAIDFILKYIVCPWEEIGAYSIAVMLSSIGLLILVMIMISLNKINDFAQECKKLRLFIYVICIFLIPCFGILLPIYFYIPAMLLSFCEIKKKEQTVIKKLFEEYSIEKNYYEIYKSVRANIKLEVSFVAISSVFIISIMHVVGFKYHFLPVLPAL